MITETTPWVEKYRPDTFEKIIIDPYNKKIFNSMIENKYFPNLLLYGPPGTGKTTTIINIINKINKYSNNSKELVIHLNASDERGIDTVRSQIKQFVDSNTMFVTGTKFVILDEVDYMTKQAQQSLKYLLQSNNKNVCFCLICNYISRIDSSLQNYLLKVRFNKLHEDSILSFLRDICISENMNISDEKIIHIQNMYNSDIRSMINYLQCNKNNIQDNSVLNISVCNDFYELLLVKDNYKNITICLNNIEYIYNINLNHFAKLFLKYIIKHHPQYISDYLIEIIEKITHTKSYNTDYLQNFFVLSINKLMS